jgi:hypothetical protein
MAQIKPIKTWRVDIMEYERGWGSRLDESIYFDNEVEAKDYVTKFNSQNTADTAPDWYMVASYQRVL